MPPIMNSPSSRLEAFVPGLDASHFDLSRLIEATDFADLADIRSGSRDAAIEGVGWTGVRPDAAARRRLAASMP